MLENLALVVYYHCGFRFVSISIFTGSQIGFFCSGFFSSFAQRVGSFDGEFVLGLQWLVLALVLLLL